MGCKRDRADGIIEAAKNALAMGIAMKQVEQFTGMSREEIESYGV
jgi:hypothetical protein